MSKLEDLDFRRRYIALSPVERGAHPGEDKQIHRSEMQYAEMQSNENQQEEQRSSDTEGEHIEAVEKFAYLKLVQPCRKRTEEQTASSIYTEYGEQDKYSCV